MDPAGLLLFDGESGSGGGGGGGEPLVRLHRDGLHVKRPDGSIWKYRGVTGFSMVDDVKHGRIDKVRTYLRWARSLNFNLIRVFCTWENLKLKVDWDATRETLHLAHDEGLWVHLVGLCDQVAGASVHLPRDDQIQWLRTCIDLADEIGNVLIEEFNEFEKNDDDGVCGVLEPTDYVSELGTRSWWGENQHWNHAGSLLSWTTGHTDRGTEWARTFIQALDVSRRGYGLPDGTSVPPTGRGHVLGEPRRIAEGTTPRQHADYQAGSLLMGIGGCTHGGFSTIDPDHESDLQYCIPPTGLALACCAAVSLVHASTLWPGETPEGNYHRGGVNDENQDNKPDCPILHRDRYFGGSPTTPAYEEPAGAVRSFFMELGGLYYGLAVDPGPTWTLQVRDGFRLVAQGGYDDGIHGGNMLVLSRV